MSRRSRTPAAGVSIVARIASRRATQRRRQQLRTREHLIRMRTQTINALRAIVRQAGMRLPSGTARDAEPPGGPGAPQFGAAGRHHAVARHARGPGPDHRARGSWVRDTAAHDRVAQRLMTVPGVGGVVALTYQAALDTPARFAGHAGRASAYLGLVPGEHSSGERQRKGAITKAGPRAPQRCWCKPRGPAGARAAAMRPRYMRGWTSSRHGAAAALR